MPPERVEQKKEFGVEIFLRGEMLRRVHLFFILLLTRLLPNASFVKGLAQNFWDSFWHKEFLAEQAQASDGAAPKSEIRNSERAVFIEAVASCWPFRSVLDVGCGFAQNAHILNELFWGLRYVGIDLDAQRIEQGRALIARQGIRSMKLVEADMCDLSEFPDRSADIVLASASLLYVNDKDIQTVARALLRIARKGVVILEQHCEKATAEGRLVTSSERADYWIRDYREVFISEDRSLACREYAISNPRWDLEHWPECARVFVFAR